MRIILARGRSIHGFSLPELLVVVSAIALLTGLALPALGNAHRSAGQARDVENARSLASIAQSAQAAGVDFVDPSGSVLQTVRNIAAGGTAIRGALAGQTFRVPMPESEIPGAAQYLQVENGPLLYRME